MVARSGRRQPHADRRGRHLVSRWFADQTPRHGPRLRRPAQPRRGWRLLARGPFIATDVSQAEGDLAFRLNPDELVVAGPDNRIRASGDPDSPALYLHVRRGCEARLNRSTYEQLARIALERGDDWTVTSGGETFSLRPA